jgi:hypothetical protein
VPGTESFVIVALDLPSALFLSQQDKFELTCRLKFRQPLSDPAAEPDLDGISGPDEIDPS